LESSVAGLCFDGMGNAPGRPESLQERLHNIMQSPFLTVLKDQAVSQVRHTCRALWEGGRKQG
jgi:hypothetical protein